MHFDFIQKKLLKIINCLKYKRTYHELNGLYCFILVTLIIVD